MKTFKILQRLPKWYTETQREQMKLEKGSLETYSTQGCPNLQFEKTYQQRAIKYSSVK